jgi:hypothetical protein
MPANLSGMPESRLWMKAAPGVKMKERHRMLRLDVAFVTMWQEQRAAFGKPGMQVWPVIGAPFGGCYV